MCCTVYRYNYALSKEYEFAPAVPWNIQVQHEPVVSPDFLQSVGIETVKSVAVDTNQENVSCRSHFGKV